MLLLLSAAVLLTIVSFILSSILSPLWGVSANIGLIVITALTAMAAIKQSTKDLRNVQQDIDTTLQHMKRQHCFLAEMVQAVKEGKPLPGTMDEEHFQYNHADGGSFEVTGSQVVNDGEE